MVTTVNRTGVTELITDMLKTDTTVLYGPGKLVQVISFDSSKFEKAKIDINNPYKMYVFVEDKETIEKRQQFADEMYTLSYRVEGLHSSPDEAKKIIDQIDERISVLIDTEFSTGDLFTTYHEDSSVNIYDCEYDNSDLVVETKNNKVIAECEGAINVYLYREE